jgi:hypothetical protein
MLAVSVGSRQHDFVQFINGGEHGGILASDYPMKVRPPATTTAQLWPTWLLLYLHAALLMCCFAYVLLSLRAAFLFISFSIAFL